MMRHRLVRGAALLAVVAAVATAHAQEVRDPTLPPGEPGTVAGGAAVPAPAAGNTVIVRNGKPYLVVGTRLVGVGHMVGQARLERITETEIWLRENGAVQKLPRFAGIQRRASVATACGVAAPQPVPATAAPSRPAAKRKPQALVAPAALPCEGAQP